MAGLTRQALRRRPWSFAGPATTQCLAAALVVGALDGAASLHAASRDPAVRRALDASGVQDVAPVFLLISIYLTMIIVGATMTSTIARQARDIALVRAIGATPARVRRAIAGQAALVAAPATLLGVPLGALLGRAWIAGLVAHGVAPAAVTFHPFGAALPVALAVTVGTSFIGAMVAAVRPSRIRPAVALTEAAVPRRRPGAVRTSLGVLLVAGGVARSISLADGDPSQVNGDALLVMLAMCVGCGLLAPVLLRVTGPLARPFGGTGTLAAESLAVRARAFSGALVPLVLAVAFTTMKVVQHATSAHVHGVPDPSADLWIDYSGTAVYVLFAAVAAVNTLATVLLDRRRELAVIRLVGATRRRALAVVICEALVVTGTGLVAAAGVAAAVLLPILHATLGTWLPYLPPGELVVGLLGVAGLVGFGTAVPAAVSMRRPPVESVAVEP